MRDDRERLQNILEAIENIEKYSAVGHEEFCRDELIQTWITHHILIIGEAASRLSEEFRQRHPEIPWREMILMRNLLVHAYFRVEADEVWNVAIHDLPKLKLQIHNCLDSDEQ